MPALDWSPDMRPPFLPSAILVYGFGVVAFGVVLTLLIGRWLIHRRRLLSARAQLAARGELVEGAAVLTGRVAPDEPDPPVRVAIAQKGREWKTKNGWAHQWKETDRSTTVRPFRLELDGGEVVRVVPDDDVRLVDALDRTEPNGYAQRTRIATLSPGERVTAIGTLVRERVHGGGGGYRDTGTELVLRARKGARLLLSAKPLDEPAERWTRFYRRAIYWTLATIALAHGVFYLPFHRLTLFGQPVTALVTHHRTYITTSKNSKRTHYEITATCDAPACRPDRALTDEVSRAAYDTVVDGVTEAPFLVAPGVSSTTYEVGVEPQLSEGALAFTIFGILAYAAAFFVFRARNVAWFEKATLVEGGSGRLPRPD